MIIEVLCFVYLCNYVFFLVEIEILFKGLLFFYYFIWNNFFVLGVF